MILRVPDYFGDFTCTAGWCKDSCCIGWEINIDEETKEFYSCAGGEIGDKLRQNMYENEEGVAGFRLGRKGRCPFLNAGNLCEICIYMGEEALSEVCTEYPRFSLWYADVQQKCLSLSCEEAGRLLFSKEDPVEFVEMELPGDVSFEGDEDVLEDEDMYDENPQQMREKKDFLEQAQTEAIAILQNRTKSIEERMRDYLSYLTWIQNKINHTNLDAGDSLAYTDEELEADVPILEFPVLEQTYEQHVKRMDIFNELEGNEGILVASKIADRVGITRSVIVNALRKFESAGVIESRSSGMKGTYIKVLNDVVFDELKKL